MGSGFWSAVEKGAFCGRIELLKPGGMGIEPFQPIKQSWVSTAALLYELEQFPVLYALFNQPDFSKGCVEVMLAQKFFPLPVIRFFKFFGSVF